MSDLFDQDYDDEFEAWAELEEMYERPTFYDQDEPEMSQ